MPIPSTCLHCGAKFQAPEKFAGKKVKCPKCEQAITIPSGELKKPPAPPADKTKGAKPAPAAKAKPQPLAAADGLDFGGLDDLVANQSAPVPAPPQRAAMPTVAHETESMGEPIAGGDRRGDTPVRRRIPIGALAVGLSIGLLAGYFAGREHLKYEMRSALRGAAEKFSESMQKGLGGLGSGPEETAAGEADRNAQAEREAAREQAAQLQVLSVTLTHERDGFVGQNIITLRVRNNSDMAIARAEFQGVYQTPGRAVPWAEGGLSYDIDGGLEPGEEAEWRLRPNRFGTWGRLEVRDGAQLMMTPSRLGFAGG